MTVKDFGDEYGDVENCQLHLLYAATRDFYTHFISHVITETLINKILYNYGVIIVWSSRVYCDILLGV
jgi:hypothetical protein